MTSYGERGIRERRWEKDIYGSLIYLYKDAVFVSLAPSWDVLTSKTDELVREKMFVSTSSVNESQEKDGAAGQASLSNSNNSQWPALCDDVFASGED